MDKLTAAETMIEGGCLCPECGWAGGPTPIKRLWHWKRLGLILLTGGAFVGFVVWLSLTGGTSRMASHGMIPRFAESGFSQQQVEAIASGEQIVGGFAHEVLDAANANVVWREVERHVVSVSYLDPKGERSSWRSRGWPISWMSTSKSDSYDDMLRKTGRQVSVSDPTAAPLAPGEVASDPRLVPVQPTFERASFSVWYRPPPEKTGGSYVMGFVNPLLLLSLPLATCVALWYALFISVWLASLLGIKAGKLRTGKARFVVVCAFGIVFFAMDLLYVKTNTSPPSARTYTSQRVGTYPGFSYSKRKEFRQLSVSLDELEEIVAAPNADENVAKLICEALDDVQYMKGKRLAIAADPEALMHDSESLFHHQKFRVIAIMQRYFMRRSDFGPEELVAPIAGLRVHHQGMRIEFMWSSGAAEEGTRSVNVRIDLLAMVIVVTWFVWWLPHMLLCGFPRMRAFKRRMSGRCIHCAYPLVSQDQKNIQEINIGS